jgi:CcmD family protein
MKKLLLCMLLILGATGAFAQPATMADTFRSSGKIYVVIAIIAIIFTGLAIYLFSMDRRLKKLEKRN